MEPETIKYPTEEEQHTNLTEFRRRNNAIVFILIFLIILLTVTIGSLYFSIIRSQDSPHPDRSSVLLNPAVQAYCAVACNTSSSLNIVYTMIAAKSTIVTNPNQIFILSLQSAEKELKDLASSLTEPAFKNCSDSLEFGSDQIRRVLETMLVDPYVERLGEERLMEMVKRIAAAEENLDSCADVAQREVREKVRRVMVHVSGGGKFLAMHDVVLGGFEIEARDWWIVIFGCLGVCVSGVYLWFIFYFVRVFLRFLGVKSQFG